MGAKNTRRLIPLGSATLTIVGSVIAFKLTESLSNSQSLVIVLAWIAAGIIVTYFVSRVQARSKEVSPEAIKERVRHQLEPTMRKHVQARSYGDRRNLIEAPLRELDPDITPRLGWVSDPRLLEPEPFSENSADDIVDAFKSSKRRLLLVGEPGSGKTMAAYSLIEYLAKAEGAAGRIPLLVNLSAWEAQENFEAFLVDYLCSSVGYEIPERADARAFISSDRYALILDGLDEMPLRLRAHFSERLDEFMRDLPSEVGVVVTCRTQEYKELLAAHPSGLGFVQAVEIYPLTDQQLDSAFVKLAQRDKDWKTFLSQRHLTAYKRVRHLMSNPLFLNLAVAGHLSPDQLLDSTTTEQDLRDFVLETYLDRALADPRHYEPEDARRYLSWVARFLNGAEVSPFGLKTKDFTVFDLADLTPPDPPRRYRLFEGLGLGLLLGLGLGLVLGLVLGLLLGLLLGLVLGLGLGLVFGLVFGLVLGLPAGGPVKGFAVSYRLSLASWPLTRRQLLGSLRPSGVLGLGLFAALVWGGLVFGLVFGLFAGLVWGLLWALFWGLLEPPSVLISSRTPMEARSRSLIAALTWLVFGLFAGLGLGLLWGLVLELVFGLVWGGLVFGLFAGLGLGLLWALRFGGWFVLLQKVAHRRLARAGNLPPRLYDFLEWGIERQIFRRAGGGVRFCHNLIQQHLASTSESVS